ncbi:MAG: nitrite reductase (NAD(P)H) small subunit, partial [Pedobacter sp.]|nr:nitrite reductase (NAD(P)H) small subunit [Chitinophagaceae bacterium]
MEELTTTNNHFQNVSPKVGGTWFLACKVEDVPTNGGVCVKYNDQQIALFHFTRRGEWYATQN